jgi:hypothetical protein
LSFGHCIQDFEIAEVGIETEGKIFETIMKNTAAQGGCIAIGVGDQDIIYRDLTFRKIDFITECKDRLQIVEFHPALFHHQATLPAPAHLPRLINTAPAPFRPRPRSGPSAKGSNALKSIWLKMAFRFSVLV